MRVLAIDPYHGGSHRALLDGWVARSRHDFEVLTLPPHHWKWRMRHGPVTLADQIRERNLESQPFAAIWCSSMLNLAEFRGLVAPALRTLPTVVYFHENQLDYPVRHDEPRDLHFAFTNLTTALSADAVWFNSSHNQRTLLSGLRKLLRSMPDYTDAAPVDQIAAKARVIPPGVDLIGEGKRRADGPLHILWAARWEHDKGPDAFFEALSLLSVDFRVSVLGQSFQDVPEIFDRARGELASRVVHWGYVESREAYVAALREADAVVSTADHEFFGIAVVEAVSAGCLPVLPNRLVYPELFTPDALYDGSPAGLAAHLTELANRKATTGLPASSHTQSVARFGWDRVAPEMDAALEAVAAGSRQCETPRH